VPRPHKKTPSAGPSDEPASQSALHRLLELITRPWTMHILLVLGRNGPARFGALRRSIEGISSRVLTERLRMLEEKGFIFRHYKATIPPEVTYGITSRMKNIERVFTELDKVAQNWQHEGALAKPERT
jgi:DNA-binding HxlR family transcriptional regulator